MPKFIRGDRVYILDKDPVTSEPTPRERLAMVTAAVDAADGGSSADGEASYALSVPGIDGQSLHSSQEFPESDLELAGSLGERYEQVVGPYNDFITIWSQALKLGRKTTLSRDVDIIGINWPEWFLLVEIRGTGVEVPLPRDHPEWRWHLAVMAH